MNCIHRKCNGKHNEQSKNDLTLFYIVLHTIIFYISLHNFCNCNNNLMNEIVNRIYLNDSE